MTQKNFFRLAAIIVGFVWVFCGTFAIALTVQRRPDKNIPTTAPLATTTTTPSQNQNVFATSPTSAIFPVGTTMPTSPLLQPEPTAPTGTPTITEPPTTQISAPQGNEAIIAAYINGINQLKSTPNFSMDKNDTLNITIDEITGGSIVESVANSLIPQPSPESYSFVGGVDSATGKSPNATVAPLNVPAKVDPSAVTSALSQANADGGYTVQLILKEELQTLTSPAPNLSTMVQVIDIAPLIPSGFTLTEVTINYAPSTIIATFDSQNRIVSMQHKLVSQGGGGGKLAFPPISASMSMHGEYISNYTIVYN